MDKIHIETKSLDDEGKLVEETCEIEPGPEGITLVVHPQTIGIEIPEFVEVNPQDTINCISAMSQPQWKWVSRGPRFRYLWKKAFAEDAYMEPPKDIEVLNKIDAGYRHIAGLITLACEAYIAGKNIFFRTPENHLHPKQQQTIMDMFIAMKELFGGSGGKETATEEDLDEEEEKSDDEHCVEWLNILQEEYGPDKEISEMNGKRLTVSQILDEIDCRTDAGALFVREFVNLRDGKQ